MCVSRNTRIMHTCLLHYRALKRDGHHSCGPHVGTQGARCVHACRGHLAEVKFRALHALVPQPDHWLAQTGATTQLMHTYSRHQAPHISPPSLSLRPLTHCAHWRPASARWGATGSALTMSEDVHTQTGPHSSRTSAARKTHPPNSCQP